MEGKKYGGRKAGTPNKASATLKERLASWGCDPFKIMADIAAGELLCGVCRGAGKTKFQSGDGEGIRKCQSCWGSGKERISPQERNRAASEIAKYTQPQLKAIEHSGPDGGPVQASLTVKFVKTDGSNEQK